MRQLFTPIALGKLNLPNRIIIAPMCQYSADHGKATEWHTLHLGHLSLSGAGLLIVEASSVAPEGRITPSDLGLWDEATGADAQRPSRHSVNPEITVPAARAIPATSSNGLNCRCAPRLPSSAPLTNNPALNHVANIRSP
ncbi:hypothetical protein M2406_000593 [Serratia sp. BIGb0163]|nr:hypothetical protein [Serratia sp. BIGb0163]